MNERERLMRRISTVDFAIVELHLYLDTHPDSNEMAKKLEEYENKSRVLREEYEAKFGPISLRDSQGNQWTWISNPWPWDNSEKGE